jgi:hypothetical protein
LPTVRMISVPVEGVANCENDAEVPGQARALRHLVNSILRATWLSPNHTLIFIGYTFFNI